jgi:uncharacterized protein (DUF2141 family)
MPICSGHILKRFARLLLPLALVFLMLACATMVSPTGGPKDVTPPSLVNSEPAISSVNFKGNRIILTFNEFVELKTPEKYLMISPPLGKNPELKIKGHSVVIKIEDSLRSNTTYNFYLGDAIVDLTEANPIKNFNFAFSTGPDIDSLSLVGNVTDAFTRLPVKGALVMLYTDFTDTVPVKTLPVYVSRTTDDGRFRLNNLAGGKYRAVALVDGNSDFMYNLPTEMVGFSSDSVSTYYSPVSSNDTASLSLPESPGTQMLVSLDLFPEPDSAQRILRAAMAAANRMSIAFRYPLREPSFKVLNSTDTSVWSLREWNTGMDTLNAWLIHKPDTLHLEVSDRGSVIDTVDLPTALKQTGRAKSQDKNPPLRFNASASGGFLGYDTPLSLSFANPVQYWDPSRLKLKISGAKDTLYVTPQTRFTDSIHRHLLITHAWNTAEAYDLMIPKAAFTGMYGDSCDSTHIVFKLKPLEEYGRFFVNLKRRETGYPVIVQLLSDKGTVLMQRHVTTDKKVDFGLLMPGKYGLKVILDKNGNGRWDTGVFSRKIQPETVMVHPKIFEVRTNWELEEEWEF